MSSSRDKNLNRCLDDQDYGIIDELKMQNILQEHTGCRWDFQQAPKYNYDLRVFRWDDEPESIEEDREEVGYIELERAEKWECGGFPDDWDRLCFLRRKVHEFYGPGRWGDEPKNGRPTLYLKFSHQMDRCFMAPVPVIDEYGVVTPRSDGTKDNTYLSLQYGDPSIQYDIDNCVEFLKDYFEQ